MPNEYIFDTESPVELARLLKQDQIFTGSMGGVLPELSPLTLERTHTILDLACGPGGWALEAAKAYPQKRVVGVDISRRMIEFARAQAQLNYQDNVRFEVMDILQPLAFPDSSFDIVNMRFVALALSRSTWPQVIEECKRVLRPGGTLRIVEDDGTCQVNELQDEVKQHIMRQLWETGKAFSPTEMATGPAVRMLLKQHGFQQGGLQPYLIDYSHDSPVHDYVVEDFTRSLALLSRFLQARSIMTAERLETQIQKVQEVLHRENFSAYWRLIVIWGSKPLYEFPMQ